MNSIYDYPAYYEVAFSFRDIRREVDTLERCMSLFSRIPVHTMLELGCGPAPHMPELMRRGYEYIGIDLNQKMLDFASARAVHAGFSPTLLRRDMVQFTLARQVDFVFILLGSLYAANAAELSSHFESVAATLRPGGIYFLDWCVQFTRSSEDSGSWEIKQNQLRVKTSYTRRAIDAADHIFEEVIRLKVNDGDNELELEERNTKRAIYPQEFLFLTETMGLFEFMGWRNNWNLDEPLDERGAIPHDKRIERPIVVIRRI
ncbi:MAG: class I SAM-dependent methyltransferase [Candidatus Abyssobacteria bacterium SURF_17]|uniref:Class I SAM-dependent methyltransferase n=1 Tax=Candidatus Abyssobacteria bacterium SURF_17 TaxID=2093361 RepID=A0A419F9C3_9BACT|nr:MAG: class I SAM-dependent methyltransferase [Candidatus Abyssubacteria bacterium SURF_17]